MHVSVDIETLGVRTRAPIVAIAAVVFDPEARHVEICRRSQCFFRVCALDTIVDSHIEGGTLKFWLGTNSDLLLGFLQDPDAVPLITALCEFKDFLNTDTREVTLWERGDFDVPFLAEKYRSHCYQEPPWHYAAAKEVRTLEYAASMVGYRKPERPQDWTQHQPLYDAAYQALCVQQCVAALRSA